MGVTVHYFVKNAIVFGKNKKKKFTSSTENLRKYLLLWGV